MDVNSQAGRNTQSFICSPHCSCPNIKYPCTFKIFDIIRKASTPPTKNDPKMFNIGEIKALFSLSSSKLLEEGLDPSKITQAYIFLVLDESQKSKQNILSEINNLNLNEKAILYTIVRRIKFGCSINKLSYTPSKMISLIWSKSIKKKTVQDYRRIVINEYHAYTLKQATFEFRGDISDHLFMMREKYLEKYFKDYLDGCSNSAKHDLMKRFFFYDSRTRKKCNNFVSRRFGNISYLSYFLPLSKLFAEDLSKFCRKIFVRRCMKNIELKIERVIEMASLQHNRSILNN